MTLDTYITALAPQLLDLLDDPAVDNKRIASYVIGTGFLSKRKLGSPGTVGWRLFAEPIIGSLNPPSKRCLVEEDQLRSAIDRLSALIHFHTNPGLIKRLVSPVLLSLWGLQCYASDHNKAGWADQAHLILCTYMKISATQSQLQSLSKDLLWDGGPLWTFMPGSGGGIEIRPRERGRAPQFDIAKKLESIDNRVSRYSNLLNVAIMTDAQLGEIFTTVSKRWLLGSHSTLGIELLGTDEDDSRNPMESLVNAKLTQKLLEDYKDRIGSSSESIIKLVEPILSAFIDKHRRRDERLLQTSKLSLASLGDIVTDDKATGDEKDVETVAIGLNILSAILTLSENFLSNIEAGLLDNIQDSLRYLAQVQSSSEASISMTASNILMLLQVHADTPNSSQSDKSAADGSDVLDQKNHHRKALHCLSDELAPVRAQGLSLLTDLVNQGSPVLNIPSSVFLLLSLLQDEDEYIYLSAIKTIGLLASSHPKTVVKMLVERYTDSQEESTLDVRIKIGEALNKTVEHLGQLFTEDIAELVGESMIAIASRRGNKMKTSQERQKAKRKAEKAKKEAKEAWGGEAPSEEDDADDDNTKIEARIARVVEGWADTGREEDIRIRTSALSILGTAIETNVRGVGASLTSTAVDCVLAILKLEKSQERAILRRAAVMVIVSVVKAIDSAEERGQQLDFGFAGQSLSEVVIVLKYVEMTDADDVTVGHIRVLIESLEAWQQKSLLGLAGSRNTQDSELSIEALRIGNGGRTVQIEELS
ncbi:MAG: hypothetical protein Q9219_001784 [cf. Caloplaca sp. 3 TL-2023]